jgi:hypothetical protein
MFNKLAGWVGTTVWNKFGRKAIESLLTTIFTGLFLIVNSWLLKNAGFGIPDDQIHLWILGIVGWAVTAIFGQSVVDGISAAKGTYRTEGTTELINAQARLEVLKDINNPATSTKLTDAEVTNILDKI